MGISMRDSSKEFGFILNANFQIISPKVRLSEFSIAGYLFALAYDDE
jgi:hypothetical protein